MKISIIVPIYNVEKYLKQCVDSIINQTYKNLEIILVDDGSPDKCPQICDNYADFDNRIKVVHKQNGGLMSARQAGLKQASGDYVGFVDGDDWIEPDMFEHFFDMINKYNPDMIQCEFLYSYPDKDFNSRQNLNKEFYNKQELIDDVYPNMLYNGNYYSFGINPCCWSKLFKRELLESVLYNVTPKIKMGEDVAFTYPCLLKVQNLAYIDNYLYHYRNNEQSMTNAYDSKMENYILIPFEILKNTFSEYKYQFGNQLSYYLLFLLNLIVRNESKAIGCKSVKSRKLTLNKFMNNKELIEYLKNIDLSSLPIHTRVVALLFKFKCSNLMVLYSYLLRKFM